MLLGVLVEAFFVEGWERDGVRKSLVEAVTWAVVTSFVADGTRRVALCRYLVCEGHGSGCASSDCCFEMREGGVCVDCEWWLRRGVVGIVSGKMEFGFCQSTKQLDSHWLCPQLGAAGPHWARA